MSGSVASKFNSSPSVTVVVIVELSTTLGDKGRFEIVWNVTGGCVKTGVDIATGNESVAKYLTFTSFTHFLKNSSRLSRCGLIPSKCKRN